MADIVIRTNNVPRDLVDAWELSPKERAEFDYIDWQAIEDGRDSAVPDSRGLVDGFQDGLA